MLGVRSVDDHQSFLHLTEGALRQWLVGHNQPPYRTQQIFDWVYRQSVWQFDHMSNIPTKLQALLRSSFSLQPGRYEVLQSQDGTRKYQFTLSDGQMIESVWIPETRRHTLCISSQVGCAMRCAFCVTGVAGLKRNLKPEEIVFQVWMARVVLQLPVTNIVFMGMGEPLHNMNAVCQAIDILCMSSGFGFGRRKITVSTVGLVPDMPLFYNRAKVKLAISLTGFTDTDRDYWMPINKAFPLASLIKTIQKLPIGKGQRFTFEVVVIKGQTDSDQALRSLVQLLKPVKAKVNLIPYNENPYFPHLQEPDRSRLEMMRSVLKSCGIPAMVRESRGRDIMGACGQLAGRQRIKEGD